MKNKPEPLDFSGAATNDLDFLLSIFMGALETFSRRDDIVISLIAEKQQRLELNEEYV